MQQRRSVTGVAPVTLGPAWRSAIHFSQVRPTQGYPGEALGTRNISTHFKAPTLALRTHPDPSMRGHRPKIWRPVLVRLPVIHSVPGPAPPPKH
eukprot:108613-Chlamydomonas_euryale.AAC.1